ncbi:MAG: retropepsin-like aspartic protease [Pseudomonadota bacterium]
MPRRRDWLVTLVLGAAGGSVVRAQGAEVAVALSGILGRKALLVIDGGAPRALAVGESHGGVRLVEIGADQATVEIGTRRSVLRLGEAPVQLAGGAGAGSAAGAGRRIVLSADSLGHFFANGSINGRAVRFMVDTGASTIGLSQADAERIGLNLRAATPVRVGTANGATQGWLVKLSSVRVGEVELYEVDAIVTAQPMPYVLLGNSFLNRFQMQREGAQMVLERRF